MQRMEGGQGLVIIADCVKLKNFLLHLYKSEKRLLRLSMIERILQKYKGSASSARSEKGRKKQARKKEITS